MVNVVSQIQDYLKLLNLKFMWNSSDGVFELVFTERKDGKPVVDETVEDDVQFKYVVFVKPGEKWVQVFCDIYPLDKIPEEKRDAVFLDLLAANRDYAEVCFDFDKARGIVGSSQEMLSVGLNFDVFRDEFFAVPWAVKKFWTDIATKHGLE